jgi:hypothetical protein
LECKFFIIIIIIVFLYNIFIFTQYFRFYATFIPFWFWNVDGAVGRRIVMVWSLLMYIGKVQKLSLFTTNPGFEVF